ncbi:unnamed protein product, partial [Discosporangium mesarthrocarpum]
TDLVSVLKKIACDEAIFAPQLACSYLAASAFITYKDPPPVFPALEAMEGGQTAGKNAVGTIEGGGGGRWAAVRRNVREKALATWSDDLKVWPAANLIGFSFVPRNIRPAYASCIQLGWQCYLSSVGFRRPAAPVGPASS